MHSWLMRLVAGGVALGFATTVVGADVVIGSVLAVRGPVFVDSGKGRQVLETNAPLRAGDTIESAGGKAKLGLNDGTVISVGANTRVRLADFESAARPAKARVSLLFGVMRLNAKLTPGGTFEVETETAIAAVRGTDWVVEATAMQTSVAVVTGRVEVTSRAPAPQVTVVLDEPGQGTDVRRGSPPTPPTRWGTQRFEATLARATFD